jgi:hypothetical protein
MLYSNYRPDLETDKISTELFEKMNKTERVCCLFKSGRELLSRENPDYIISLYLLTDFLVEIWYENPSKKIERIDITTNEEVMANYEQEIDLTGLF